MGIAGFCVLFAALILVFLKKLNALTHGVEDHESFSEGEDLSTADA